MTVIMRFISFMPPFDTVLQMNGTKRENNNTNNNKNNINKKMQ